MVKARGIRVKTPGSTIYSKKQIGTTHGEKNQEKKPSFFWQFFYRRLSFYVADCIFVTGVSTAQFIGKFWNYR
jgi:hypothetical protein